MTLIELNENVEENDSEYDDLCEGEDWLKNEIANFSKETNGYLEAPVTQAKDIAPKKLFTYENWGKEIASKISVQKVEQPSSSLSCSYDDTQSRKEKLSLYDNFLKIVELRKKSSDRFKWKAINKPNLFQPIVPCRLISPRLNPSPRAIKTTNIMKRKKALNEITENVTSPGNLPYQNEIFPEASSVRNKVVILVSIADFHKKVVDLLHIYHSKRDKAVRLISFTYRIFNLTRLIKRSLRIKLNLWRRKINHRIRLIRRFIEDCRVPNYRKSIKAFLVKVKKCQLITRTLIQINKARRILLQLHWNKLEIVLRKKEGEKVSLKRQQIRKAGEEERGGVSDKWYKRKQYVQNYLVFVNSVELKHDKAARNDERYKKKHTIVEIKTNDDSVDSKAANGVRERSTIYDLSNADIVDCNLKPLLLRESNENEEPGLIGLEDNISDHPSLPSSRRETIARLSVSQPQGVPLGQPIDAPRLSISESSLPVRYIYIHI
jgi:hypothetical protein